MRYGFEIIFNNEKPVRAGLANSKGVISCILDVVVRKGHTEEELSLNVSGLDSDADVHLDWYKGELQPGDKIQVTVVENDFDTPQIRQPRLSKEDIIAQKIRYFHHLKEELKDYLPN